MSPKGLELIKDLGLEVEKQRGRVLVANSQVDSVSQEILRPVEFHNRFGKIRVRALKSLPVTFALGLNFLKFFKIEVDFENGVRFFRDDPNTIYEFQIEDWSSEKCSGVSELSLRQVDLLKEFLDRELPKPPERPILTDLTEHVIDVGDHAPIKQRHYLVSPKVMEAIVAEFDKMFYENIIVLFMGYPKV